MKHKHYRVAFDVELSTGQIKDMEDVLADNLENLTPHEAAEIVSLLLDGVSFDGITNLHIFENEEPHRS